jgi:hypothetical protein
MAKKIKSKEVAAAKQKPTLNKFEATILTVGMLLAETGGDDIFEIKAITKKGKITIKRIGDEDWGSRDYESAEELLKKYNIMDKTLEEYEQELLKEMASGWASYKQPSGEVTSKEIVVSSGADKAAEAQRSLVAITKKMEILTNILTRKKNELYEIKRNFEEQLDHVNRVVGIIELYLGVNEDITLFQDGEAAPIETPITFRQLVLHMDEEVADWRKGGWDFENIEDFEKWLRIPKNLQQVLPEDKGVVILRPRRNDKDYNSDNPFADSERNRLNRKTFVLIRNGQKLYHIFSEDIYIYPHLFPSDKEMNRLYKLERGERLDDERWYSSSDQEKAKAKLMGYQRNILFLQGLMDRTEVFRPMPQPMSLFKPETCGEYVKFIHDADGLTDGRISYDKWLEQINSKLKRGDRIYLINYPSGFEYGRNDYRYQDLSRFPIMGWTHSPDPGVYNLLEEVTNEDHSEGGFRCKHKPDAKVWKRDSWDSKDRKMSTPFIVYKDDEFIINYELITIEDIDYYLNDRINRRHYLKMMPVLRGIREKLVAEKKMENEFIKMVKGAVLKEAKLKVTEDDIKAVIEWWKTKVIEKRPLTKDDAKAARMIMDELKRRNK